MKHLCKTYFKLALLLKNELFKQWNQWTGINFYNIIIYQFNFFLKKKIEMTFVRGTHMMIALNQSAMEQPSQHRS